MVIEYLFFLIKALFLKVLVTLFSSLKLAFLLSGHD